MSCRDRHGHANSTRWQLSSMPRDVLHATGGLALNAPFFYASATEPTSIGPEDLREEVERMSPGSFGSSSRRNKRSHCKLCIATARHVPWLPRTLLL